MKSLKAVLASTAILLMVSCSGGGGSPGTSPFFSDSCTGTDPNCVSAASKLVLELSSPTIINDGSAQIAATATATTAAGQAISGIPVSFSVDNNAIYTIPGSATGTDGKLVATVTIGADPSNRIVTVKAMSGGLVATASFAVKGAKLAATASAAILAPGESTSIEFRLTNSNDVALPNQPIVVNGGTAGSASGMTGVNGDYVFAFTAPATLGALDIVATAGGVTKTQTVVVQTSASTIPVAVGPILSASVAANPSVVATNTIGSTVNRTEIRALFVGANNAPIKNVRVKFDLNGDPASIGGQFSTNNAVIYSDATGIATTAYIPADRASPTNGVTIRACYSTTDFATGCPNAATATITVVADPLSVTIGSNAVVYIGPNDLTYQRRFVILVVDASGRAKGNVDVVPSIDLPTYYKGQYVRGTVWFPGKIIGGTPTFVAPYACPNEDLNRNAVNEAGDDVNGNGSLEPRKSDVAVSMIGGSKTQDDGTAIVQVEYPQNVASWVQIKLLVSATGISGTEGRATWTEILPVPSSAITADTAPPFIYSPYGVTVDAQPAPPKTPCQLPG